MTILSSHPDGRSPVISNRPLRWAAILFLLYGTIEITDCAALFGMQAGAISNLYPQFIDHPMYGGIYEKMLHPQAVGESVTWLGGAFLLDSPFLVIYSLVWLPIYYFMCRAEERDLMLRFGQAYGDYMQRVGFFGPKQ